MYSVTMSEILVMAEMSFVLKSQSFISVTIFDLTGYSTGCKTPSLTSFGCLLKLRFINLILALTENSLKT